MAMIPFKNADGTVSMVRRRTPVYREVPGAVLQQPTPSAPFTINMPLKTYAKMLLFLTATAVAATRAQIAAQVVNIRVAVSGRELWVGTGAGLLALQQFYSQVDSATAYPGYVSFDFLRGWVMDRQDGQDAVLGLSDQATLQIEVTMGAGATINGATIFAYNFQEPEQTGIATRIVRLSPNVGATGLTIYPDLPPPRAGETLLAIHTYPPVVANLTRIGYVADDVRIIDATPSALNRMYVEAGQPRTPQDANGQVTLDFTALTGDPSDGVDMSRVAQHQLEFTFANAAPGTFVMLAEYASPISGGNG